MKPRDRSSTAAAPPQSDYASAITRVAVAQICRTVGYAAAEASGLAILTDIAGLYLRAIAKFAASSANSLGRTESNLVDVIAALEELGSVQGFDGASTTTATRHSALNSPVIRELQKFVNYTAETPFAKPLQKNAFSRRKMKLPKRGGAGEYNEEGRFRHVPKWLPAMPEIEEERKVEEKWGFGIGVKSEEAMESEGEIKGPKRELKGKDLPMKRIRVIFKLLKHNNGGIEQSTRIGGVFRKRISCEIFGDDDNDEEASSKEKKSSNMEKPPLIVYQKGKKLPRQTQNKLILK